MMKKSLMAVLCSSALMASPIAFGQAGTGSGTGSGTGGSGS